MKVQSILVICLFYAFTTFAQSYNTAIGMRFGDDLKFSINQRILSKTTLELNLSDGLFSDVKYASIMAKKHSPIISRRFNFYLGGGIYGSSSTLDKVEDEDFVYETHGLVGSMGAEFTLGRINLSLDYAPQYAINKDYNGRRLTADSALSVRYVMWSRKSSMKKFFEKIF
jgi:hypothetical protein